MFICSIGHLKLQTADTIHPPPEPGRLCLCNDSWSDQYSVPPSFHSRMQAWQELSLPSVGVSAKAWLLLLQNVCCQGLNVFDLGIMMNRIIDPAIHQLISDYNVAYRQDEIGFKNIKVLDIIIT